MFSKVSNAQRQFSKVNQANNYFGKVNAPQIQGLHRAGHFINGEKKSHPLEKSK